MEFISIDGEEVIPRPPTLILPALSIGNVGQLAVDLLISSLKANKVGYLFDPCVIPCVGNDAYGPDPQGILALPLEAFDSPSKNLSLIQQRSPVVKGMMIQYAKNMASHAEATGTKHIVLLSGLDAGRKRKYDASSAQLYYISSRRPDGTDDDCEKLGWKKLDEYNSDQNRWQYLESVCGGESVLEDEFVSFDDQLLDEDYYPSLPFAALLSCCKAKGIQVTCILCYCSEGDNIPESFLLAEAVNKLLGLETRTSQGHGVGEGWVIPLSWKTVYGPPAQMSLF